MNHVRTFGAVLLSALLSVPALLRRLNAWTPPGLIPGESGVVVITYGITGTSTAPTGAQAALVPVQTAQLFMADTDAQAVIVHNKHLPAALVTAFYPIVVMTKTLGGASDTSFAVAFTIGKTNTNSITINKISVTAGSGGTYDVAMFFGDGPWLK